MGDLRSTYSNGEAFKKARLTYEQVASDRNLSPHFNYFLRANWATISPHFQNALARQMDKIPDIPLFDDPESHSPVAYPLMGSHIEDILQIPRPPTFGKRKRASVTPGAALEDEESDLDGGPRIRPFGVMTSPQIIKAKTELKEKKLQEAREKDERASEKEEGRRARASNSQLKEAQRLAVLEAERPLRDQILSASIVTAEDMVEMSRYPLTKPLLLQLADHIGLRVTKSTRKDLIVALLLDEGASDS